MGYFTLEPLPELLNEENHEAVSNNVGEDDKIDNTAKAAGEKEKNPIEYIPESDTRIYTLSRYKGNVSMPG